MTAHPPSLSATPAPATPLSSGHDSPRFQLRAATAQAHERLDAFYSRFDLGHGTDYGHFLQSHAVAFLPVEAALLEAGADALIPGWQSTMRSRALVADLADLDLPVPPTASSPPFPTVPDLLGGLYVLEGSRLGGAMLARAVAADLPCRFLAPGNAGGWRAFTSLLDDKLQRSADLALAARSAIAVFETFERSARSLPGADPRDA